MKRIKFCVIATVVVLATACNKEKDDQNQMTMDTKAPNVFLHLAGSGTATIDWGDGTEIEKRILYEIDDMGDWNSGLLDKYIFRHDYSKTSTHNIKITGENITHLSCSKNQLILLEIKKNASLTYLHCNDNQLSNLDVSMNTSLNYLYLSGNQLKELDISNNTALRRLTCFSNHLSKLIIVHNTSLTDLYCHNNQLPGLDVSMNTNLQKLHCGQNQIDILDVSKNSELLELYCGINRLTTLDVSNNTMLKELFCDNNLLSTGALNTLFETLHSDTVSSGKIIEISRNPGTNDCDKSIAENKGWGVSIFE